MNDRLQSSQMNSTVGHDPVLPTYRCPPYRSWSTECSFTAVIRPEASGSCRSTGPRGRGRIRRCDVSSWRTGFSWEQTSSRSSSVRPTAATPGYRVGATPIPTPSSASLSEPAPLVGPPAGLCQVGFVDSEFPKRRHDRRGPQPTPISEFRPCSRASTPSW